MSRLGHGSRRGRGGHHQATGLGSKNQRNTESHAKLGKESNGIGQVRTSRIGERGKYGEVALRSERFTHRFTKKRLGDNQDL